MPYFHATFEKHLPSIFKWGLGGVSVSQNWPGCQPGVYLSSIPELCFLIMIEQYAEYGHPDSVPSDHVAQIRVIVIDDSRIDKTKLGVDPWLDRRDDVWLYQGTIDVRGMPILTADDICPKNS